MRKFVNPPPEPISFNSDRRGKIAPWSSTPNLSAVHKNEKEKTGETRRAKKEETRKLSTVVKKHARSLFSRKSSETSINKQKKMAERTMTPNELEFLEKINRSNSNKKALPSLLAGLPPEAFEPQQAIQMEQPKIKKEKDLLKSLNKMIMDFEVNRKPLKPSKSFQIDFISDPRLVVDNNDMDIMIEKKKQTEKRKRAQSENDRGKLELEEFLLLESTPRSMKTPEEKEKKKKHHRSQPSLVSNKKKSSNNMMVPHGILKKRREYPEDSLSEGLVHQDELKEHFGLNYPIDVIDVVSATVLKEGIRTIAVQTPPFMTHLDLFHEDIGATKDELELWRDATKNYTSQQLAAAYDRRESEERFDRTLESLERELEEEKERILAIRMRNALNNLKIKDILFK